MAAKKRRGPLGFSTFHPWWSALSLISGGGSSDPIVSMSDYITVDDYGDYIDTTNASSVMVGTSATPVSSLGDLTKRVVSQVNGWNLDTTVDHYWLDNAIGDDLSGNETSAYIFRKTLSPTFSTSGGLCFGGAFYMSGTNGAVDDKEFIWLRGHAQPEFAVQPGNDFITGKFVSVTHGFQVPSAGVHSYIMNYDPVADEVTFWFDGVKKGTYDATGFAHPTCDEMGVVSGVRNGIDGRVWKHFWVDKSLSDSDIYQLHRSLVSGCTSTTPPPAFSSGDSSYDGTTVSVTFDWAIKASSPKDGFTVYVNGSPATISSGAINADYVTMDLTLATPLVGDETLLVSYDSGTGTVQSSGYGIAAASFTNQSVTNYPPPSISSATLSGANHDQVVITYTETVSASTPTSGFTVNLDGSPATINSGSVSGTDLTLTLSAGVAEGVAVTIDYDSATGTVISATTSKDAADETDTPCTNPAFYTIQDMEDIITSAGTTDSSRYSFLQDFRTTAGLWTDTGGTTAVTTDGDSVNRADTEYDDVPAAGGQYLTSSAAPDWVQNVGIRNPSASAVNLGTLTGNESFTVGETTMILALKVGDGDKSGGNTTRARIGSTSNYFNMLYYPSSSVHKMRVAFAGTVGEPVFTPDSNGIACVISVPDSATNSHKVYINGVLKATISIGSTKMANVFNAFLDTILFLDAGSAVVGKMLVKKALSADEISTVDDFWRRIL